MKSGHALWADLPELWTALAAHPFTGLALVTPCPHHLGSVPLPGRQLCHCSSMDS